MTWKLNILVKRVNLKRNRWTWKIWGK